MVKVIGLSLVAVMSATSMTSCASTEIVKVETTSGDEVNVRAEHDNPSGLQTPMTWGDYLWLNLISIGAAIGIAIAVGSASPRYQ